MVGIFLLLVCLDTYAHTPDNRSMIQLNEPIIEYVRRRLNEHKGEWPVIHRESGVEYDRIAKIAQGRAKNPTLAKIQPLVDWFAAWDEKRKTVAS